MTPGTIGNKYLPNTLLVIDSYRGTCNEKWWHVCDVLSFNTFLITNCCANWWRSATVISPAQACWCSVEKWFRHCLETQFQGNAGNRHHLTSFRSERLQYLFSFGLALQHRHCLPKFNFVDYLFSGGMFDIILCSVCIEYASARVQESTIKIVFNTYFSNRVKAQGILLLEPQITRNRNRGDSQNFADVFVPRFSIFHDFH